jgi:hypothetical protein
MVKMRATINEHDHQRTIEETDTAGQRRRSRNYNNYGSHSQVAAGYKDNSDQGNDRISLGYHSYGK